MDNAITISLKGLEVLQEQIYQAVDKAAREHRQIAYLRTGLIGEPVCWFEGVDEAGETAFRIEIVPNWPMDEAEPFKLKHNHSPQETAAVVRVGSRWFPLRVAMPTPPEGQG